MNLNSSDIKSFLEVDSTSFMVEFNTGEIINYYFKDVTIDNIQYNIYSELPIKNELSFFRKIFG
jgi:hypothetical protein